jgi:hypothetical protein
VPVLEGLGDKVLERSHSNALIDMVRSKVLCPRTASPLPLLLLVFSLGGCCCCIEAAAGGDSESEIESSLLWMISCSSPAAAVVFLFLAPSTAVVGDKLSCKSGGVEYCASSSGRFRHALSAGGEAEVLGSTCCSCG